MIRKATMEDMPRLREICLAAKAFMRASGNNLQWTEPGFPEDTLPENIARDELYVICGEDGVPHALFAFVTGEDPAYGTIYDGDWHSDEPYGTIHRMASDGVLHGTFAQCVEFCKGMMSHIRADTHELNRPMQHQFEKCGFVRCGTVHLADGSPRWAYELWA